MNAAPRVRLRELTPRGAGAVSVVECSGPDALSFARALGAPADVAPGELRLARLVFAGGLVDEALVAVLAPDRVELHVHGSPALVRALCAEAATSDADATLESRAREWLERAPCEAAARILLDQAEGASRAAYEELARLAPAPARALAAELARRGRVARYALAPARLVLRGPANAGKSTLFNALAGEARALVDAEPGTTRDVLAADVLLGAWPARVYDTAGERELAAEGPSRAVEAEGQRRARLVASAADLALWLARADEPASEPPAGCVALRTQADRLARPPDGAIAARNDPDGARRRVGELLRAQLRLPHDPWTPGAAVPFEDGEVDALERVARGEADARAHARARLDA